MLEEIDAVTHHVWHLVAEIDVEIFLELFDLTFRRDLVDHRLEVVVFQRRKIDADQFAVDAQHRRVVGRKVKVGGLLFRHQFEKGVNASHGRRLWRS